MAASRISRSLTFELSGMPLALRLSEGLGSAACPSERAARFRGIGLLAATSGATVRAAEPFAFATLLEDTARRLDCQRQRRK